ncbi:beta-galactosidase GalB [Limnovirga soli]|uniref:DUF4982 domain-containing protein n=1 Tax=Limnovirga soli TaxID=2656915 RepID=A0A8J8FIC0_9BACT|nr:beta-galactosidase GalB [Limnovirga soli]NNV57897.1 DUF4982 domain-containing protein [Limnovirga soli]
MIQIKNYLLLLFISLIAVVNSNAQSTVTRSTNFNNNWKFYLGEDKDAQGTAFNDAAWRTLNLPHDWSIELPFDKSSPTGTGGGALRGGVGWYRKTFVLPDMTKGQHVFIDFDGVYCNSEVFINGHSLGIRPNGYIGFRYELTPYLQYGNAKNVLAVKVNNDPQPNSRWYSGSGIYRNVWLVTTGNVFVDHWGTYISTPFIDDKFAKVQIQTAIKNVSDKKATIQIKHTIYDATNKVVAGSSSGAVQFNIEAGGVLKDSIFIPLPHPHLWSVNDPYLYKVETQITRNGKIEDRYTTTFGIRSCKFDVNDGFSLNGQHLKIRGVCMHHDLGCLGTAINTDAIERQLRILKEMGCNAIRTSHNPPAPELLELCDKMGFLVMDEAFDIWKKAKNPYDYHLSWDQWHIRDLQDQVQRDRNHPSVIIWSAGNEIPEQWGDSTDNSGTLISKELAATIQAMDSTRPIVTANNETASWNKLLVSGAFDITGYNYHHSEYADVLKKWPGKPFISTEAVSALQTRGSYDMPSDSIRRWPVRWDIPLTTGNADTTCSAYDNCSAPWGSTHEETMKVVEKYNHISGLFVWTGFDYIGEPTPYEWPARSAYFGIVDLAGFPKDVYYMYQSVWTNKTVLHLLPHWNWRTGDTIDVWAYYSNADEVELYLNGKSLGIRKKMGDDLHVVWKTIFEPGTLKAVSRKNGQIVKEETIKTAGAPAGIQLLTDKKSISPDGTSLAFISVQVVDKEGNPVPYAANDIQFTVSGEGFIAGVDNGSQTSMESFKANHRKAFNGKCLLVVQSKDKAGNIAIRATSSGLAAASLSIGVQ